MLVSRTKTITGAGADDALKRLNERNKGVKFKHCAPFIDCISKVNNTQIDKAKYLDVLIPMCNLIEYSNNYSKTPGSLWKYYRDDLNDIIISYKSFKFKIKTTGKAPAAGNAKDVKITAPLKYLENVWRTLEMLLVNYEINCIITWSENYVFSSATGATKLKITDTQLYVCVVTLSVQDNTKLLAQLKSSFKRTINRNKYQPRVLSKRENQYLK